MPASRSYSLASPGRASAQSGKGPPSARADDRTFTGEPPLRLPSGVGAPQTRRLAGTPLDAQNVVNRHFKPLLKRAGLPDIRWHDLRHSCFTLLLSRGVHPKFVQHLAGHASIQLTLDRYSHWMPSMGKHTASAMDEALDEADREDAPNDGKGAHER